jgi:sugar/nucleoside kinase (ribokinase family)
MNSRQAAELASLLAGEVIMQHGAQLCRETLAAVDSPLIRGLL